MAKVLGTSNPETLDADDGVTGGADEIHGYGGDDEIFGLGGNDTISGGAGADYLDGGAGADLAIYLASEAGVIVSLATGQGFGGHAEGDTLVNIEHLMGSNYDDVLVGDDGANSLQGLEDNDILRGRGGPDMLGGDSGDDMLKGGGGADILNGGSGADTAAYNESGAGVVVSLLADTAYGGDAKGDELNSIVNLVGSPHQDVLTGSGSANILTGLAGGDYLKGAGGADTLNGEAGNDDLQGGSGADTLNGGSGVDTASYSESDERVSVSLIADTAYDGHAEGDELNGIENLTGSDFNDLLEGSNSVNLLQGGDDNDILRGYNGADTLNGGNGVDAFEGGSGADTLNGGAGVDTAVYYESTAGVTVSLIADTAFGGHAQGDELNSIESLAGSGFADTLSGNNGANRLIGMDGGDTLIGGDGADRLIGGTGTDTTDGGSGDDVHSVNNAADIVIEGAGGGSDRVRSNADYTLGAAAEVEVLETTDAGENIPIDLTGNGFDNEIVGNDGINTLNGREGNDTLTGRGDADSFLFDTILNGATNWDEIVDFTPNTDMMVLDNDAFSGISTGVLAAGRFHIGAAATTAGQRIIYNDETGVLFHDADGSGAAKQIRFAYVDAGLALDNEDFLVVA